MTRVLGSVLLVLAVAGVLEQPTGAADDRHMWWMSETSRTELGLSPEQSRDLDAVFHSVLPRMKAEKDELDRQDRALSALLVGASDEATVAGGIERVERARAAANTTRTWMLYRMYRVLSPDQRVKVAAMHARVERERRQSPCGPTKPH
jgi:Spy/CpxP family protein refolding chaperone